MSKKNIIVYPAQMGLRNNGILQVQVVSDVSAYPIENAVVQIFNKKDPATLLEKLTTDISGRTPEIELAAPSIEYSLEPTEFQPYTEYIVIVTAGGFQMVVINSAQVLPVIKSIQPVSMPPLVPGSDTIKAITIGSNYLSGTYTPNVYEDEVKDYAEEEGAKPVVIPEFIIVHNAIPSNSTAKNYKVEYVSYIKSVVSSQIYATWPQEAIYANILTILSFTLNRIYTKWYARQGYDFDITSTVAFDHKWFYGRNIYSNISNAVDYIFNYYLSRPGIIQPILTQYCRGELAVCPNLISLWHSKTLASQGYTAIEILRYSYGDTIYINSSNKITGVGLLWPGMDLILGSTGEAVQHIQNQLVVTAGAYKAITIPEDDGTYGPATVAAVSTFQEIFNLPVTGVVDAAAWYKISRVYARLTRVQT
ncbi:MAG: peptidoglycan-binding protein [Anaerocolumna sp.]